MGYVIPLDAFTVPCEDEPDPDSVVLAGSVDEVVGNSGGSGNSTQTGLVSDKPTDTPDNKGCPKVCVAGPYEPDSNDPWIALVQRGGCQFVDKAREAQRLGAKAVVVGGDNPDLHGNPDTLVNMYSPGAHIPFVSWSVLGIDTAVRFCRGRIGCESCRNFYSLFGLHRTIFSHRNIEHISQRSPNIVPTPEHRSKCMGMVLVGPIVHMHETTSLTLAFSTNPISRPIVTFVVILLLPSFLALITLLVHRIRASRAAQRDRAPEDIVKNLPWRVWNGTRWEKADGTSCAKTPQKTGNVTDPTSDSKLVIDANSEGDDELDRVEQGSSRTHLPWYATQAECAICLEEFAVGDKVRVLPCEHVFHMNEIDDWLINRKKLVSALSLPYLRSCVAFVTFIPMMARLTEF